MINLLKASVNDCSLLYEMQVKSFKSLFEK